MTATSILVVDDEPAILDGLSRVLGQNGYSVLQAANGREGLARLEHTMPDLILSDIMMLLK